MKRITAKAFSIEELDYKAMQIAIQNETKIMEKDNIITLKELVRDELRGYYVKASKIYISCTDDMYYTFWECEEQNGPKLPICNETLQPQKVSIVISGIHANNMMTRVHPIISNRESADLAMSYLNEYDKYIDNLYDKMRKFVTNEMNRLNAVENAIKHSINRKALYFQDGTEVLQATYLEAQ